jgi:hypothetical protein
VFKIPTRSANAPLLGAVTCSGGQCIVTDGASVKPAVGSSATGSSFWSAYLNPNELKAETFTKAFEAGLKAPRAQAMDLSRMLDVRTPSFDMPRFSLPDSRPLSEVISSVPAYEIQSPGGGYGSSAGGGVSRMGMLLGVGAVVAAVLVFKSKRAKATAAKP